MGQGYAFLVYENNKKFLVELLSMKMTQNKIVVYHAKEDADTLIVLTTISIVDKDGIPVIVVTQDTDILVFLCYYHPQDSVNLFLQAGCDNIFDISSIQIADREDILILKKVSNAFLYGVSILTFVFLYK